MGEHLYPDDVSALVPARAALEFWLPYPKSQDCGTDAAQKPAGVCHSRSSIPSAIRKLISSRRKPQLRTVAYHGDSATPLCAIRCIRCSPIHPLPQRSQGEAVCKTATCYFAAVSATVADVRYFTKITSFWDSLYMSSSAMERVMAMPNPPGRMPS